MPIPPTFSDFLAFATAPDANVVPQSQWAADPVVDNGFDPGVLFGNKLNKAIRQSSFVAAGVTEMMMNVLNVDIQDDGNLVNFVTLLTQTVKALGGADLTEAPSDGTGYVRQNAAWMNTPIFSSLTVNSTTVSGKPALLNTTIDGGAFGASFGCDSNGDVQIADSATGNMLISINRSNGRVDLGSISASHNSAGASVGGFGIVYPNYDPTWQNPVAFGFDGTNLQAYVNGSLVGAVGYSGLTEAPSDGTSYSRQDGNWTNTPIFNGATVGGQGIVYSTYDANDRIAFSYTGTKLDVWVNGVNEGNINPTAIQHMEERIAALEARIAELESR